MLTLGIETSCDETGLALVRDGQILAQVMASQVGVHALFGGVVPEIASREHYRLLAPLYDRLMAEAGATMADVDVVAVARGPGLLGCLLAGVSFAKGLVLGSRARLVGVNHLHAHMLAPGLEQGLVFPAMGLLVSGGHTHLYRLDSPHEITTLGRTLDDAAGEAFDKAAKMLNLPYPGGKYVDILSRGAESDPDLFPVPYVKNDNLDFSFSGLKTAFATFVEAHPDLRFTTMPETGDLDQGGQDLANREELARVLASLSHSVVRALRVKMERALDQVLDRADGIRALVVAGGVAANSLLRLEMERLAEERGLALLMPSLALCTDNGPMIAHAGELLARAGLFHDLDLDVVPRGGVVPRDYIEQRD